MFELYQSSNLYILLAPLLFETNKYTYGYVRYSVLGGVITTTILLVGSILVIIGATKRLFNPEEVPENLMDADLINAYLKYIEK